MNDSAQSPFDGEQRRFPPPGSPSPPPPPPSSPPSGFGEYPSSRPGVAGEELATPGKRILARILDGLIVAVFFLIVTAAFGDGIFVGGVGQADALVVQVVGLVMGIAYEAAFLSSKGATPGKMLMSIKVVFDDGRRLDLHGALMRLSPNIVLGMVAFVPSLVWMSNMVNFAITVVSLVFLFTHERRQAVWDRIAKTIVIDN